MVLLCTQPRHSAVPEECWQRSNGNAIRPLQSGKRDITRRGRSPGSHDLTLSGACASPTATPAPTATLTPTATVRPTLAPATNTPSSASTPVGAATPTPMPMQTATAAPTVAPKPYGELKLGLATLSTQCLDPRLVVGSDAATNGAPLYDFVVGITPDGKLAPGLATSWEISPDGLSWTFDLRKGVKFHNGDDFTADDVKFSLDAFKAPDSKSSLAASLRNNVKSVDVVDAYTVKVTTNGPWGVFPYMLSSLEANEGMVLPKKYVEKVGWAEFGKHPVGTGPWKFVSLEKGVSNTYEANEDYWGKVPQFKRLKLIQLAEETTRISALRKGEIDAAEISISSKKGVLDAGLRVIGSSGAWSRAILFFGTYLPEAGPLNNEKVRMALSLAVNRQEIADYVYSGEAVPSAMLPVTPIAIGFDPDLKPYPYDVARARQLLKEAGYENGFSITLYTTNQAGAPELADLGQAVAGYWDKIGVKANILPIDWATMRASIVAKQQDPKIVGTALTLGIGARGSSVSQMHLMFHSQDSYRLDNNPEVDRLIDACFAEPDASKVDANLRQAVKIEYDANRSLSIVRNNILMALGKAVGDVQMDEGYAYMSKAMVTATHAR